MSDYISRALTFKELSNAEYIDGVENLKPAAKRIMSIPGIEITFCRDCRHYYEEHSNIWKEPLCFCRKWLCSHPTLPEGFCNYGEVRK